MKKSSTVVLCLFLVIGGFVLTASGEGTGGKTVVFQGREGKIAGNKEFKAGSKVETVELDEQSVEDLLVLGKLWGYLKYYHPNVALGEYNWDYELFRALPPVLAGQDSRARDKLFCSWLDSLGEFEAGVPLETPISNAKLLPDLRWISNLGFGPELEQRLLEIKDAQRRDSNYYVYLWPGIGCADFNNEKKYAEMAYPDPGYRLLSLFRYWNMIEYFFPYKYLIEEDWDGVLREFIPKFVEAQDRLEYSLAVLELTCRIHDSHAVFYSAWESLGSFWGKNCAAAIIEFFQGQPGVAAFCDPVLGKASGLQIGDIITKINDVPVEEIIAEKIKYIPASNYPGKLFHLAPKLLRTNASSLQVEVLREGRLESVQVPCSSYILPKVENYYSEVVDAQVFFWLPTSDIACIFPAGTRQEKPEEIIARLQETKGLIIDMRCYPSEMLFWLALYLLPEVTEFAQFTAANVEHPGLFLLTQSAAIGTVERNEEYYKGKVVILVNERTVSSAEYHTMMLRTAPGAVVLGSPTAGADGNISQMWLPGDITTFMSGIGVYYPDGSETQRVGIVPDLEIRPSISGKKYFRDELLERAIELIQTGQ